MVKILSITGETLFDSDKTTVRESLEEAVKDRAYLAGANLAGANLARANLAGANLARADLADAYLAGANLADAYLAGANLARAYLAGANLARADLADANLADAYLAGANLAGANLADARNVPDSYWRFCAQQMLYIFSHCRPEVPGLRSRLIEGKIDGTQYEGDCCCLVGSLSTEHGEKKVDNFCSTIPFYDKGLQNPAEQWFFQIRPGDTPEKSEFAKKAVALIDQFLSQK